MSTALIAQRSNYMLNDDAYKCQMTPPIIETEANEIFNCILAKTNEKTSTIFALLKEN